MTIFITPLRTGSVEEEHGVIEDVGMLRIKIAHRRAKNDS
jgi:hypothetical protein